MPDYVVAPTLTILNEANVTDNGRLIGQNSTTYRTTRIALSEGADDNRVFAFIYNGNYYIVASCYTSATVGLVTSYSYYGDYDEYSITYAGGRYPAFVAVNQSNHANEVSFLTVLNTNGEYDGNNAAETARNLVYYIWEISPYVNPGVHVTFNPVYIPSFPGVHVQFNPALLDPNAQGGTSDTGGGDGTFDETSDAIPVPTLPSVSVVDTGLVTLFRPSREQIADLGAYLWTHFNDFWENLQKLFTNPMDYFIAFNIFPVNPSIGTARDIYIGNWKTTIQMPPVLSQWYDFDCGVVTVQKYWGSALDYSPNTRIQLMLPFIGSVSLNTDEVMGQQLGLKYRIDLLSGACVAMLTINGNVYYQWTGECSVAVPLTGADWSRIYSAVMGAVGTAVAGVAGGMATASAAGSATSAIAAKSAAKSVHEVGYLARSMEAIPKGVRGAPAMRQALNDAAQISIDAAKQAASAPADVSNGIRTSKILGAINNTVGQVMGGKNMVSHSGTISGAAGMLGIRTPYLIIEYPNQSLAKDYKHFVGYPSNIYARLGTLTGYTEVEQVIPSGIWGTDDELAELVEALKGGVYL